MRPSLLPALLLSLALPACVVHVQGQQDAPAANDHEADHEADHVQDPGPGQDSGEPARPARVPTEARLPDCPGANEDTYCTDDGKLAGQWVLVDMLRVPEDADQLFDAQHSDVDRQPGLSVATRGDTLYLRQVTCGACARVMGQGFHGELSSLSEAQIQAVQTRLGLPEDAPLLTSTARWASYASGAGAPALQELSLFAGG